MTAEIVSDEHEKDASNPIAEGRGVAADVLDLVEKSAPDPGAAFAPEELEPPTVLLPDPIEAGKGGEGGVFQITNAEFIAAVFTDVPEGAFAAVCSKPGDPDQGGWPARRADDGA